jgi:hypothetical protein
MRRHAIAHADWTASRVVSASPEMTKATRAMEA